MNIAEKLDAIARVLQDEDLCAEAMVAEIGEIIYKKGENKWQTTVAEQCA